jgi:hypothetical protein
MSYEQRNRVLECKAVAKELICQLEHTLGVEPALPATMALLKAVEAMAELARG